MIKSKDESIRSDFLLSYFITSSYIVVLLIFPEQIMKYGITGLIGIIICYILNFKIVFKIMKNTSNIKFSNEDESSFTKVLIVSLILVGMIIINLFLGVCLVNAIGGIAYSNNPSNFDLLYYTVVTFTTIGFGDISPLTVPAKLMAIIISVTSILSLTIFIGSIFSYSDKKN
ncbi:potassium channel family protein [Clostridium paraputrificum]|uniref:potassium channel family protein n=1 Tax=Clostridium paraputrificum TaxID=29363 RepID=UPI003D334BD4